jgi:hypothetical protein
MVDAENLENSFSSNDEDEHYDAVEFDPECTFVDEDFDNDTLAFRDAVRDIWASEGEFALLMP